MIDTSEMNVVHVLFRREFWLLPDLVRGVSGGDTARAAVIGKHAAFLLDWLHTTTPRRTRPCGRRWSTGCRPISWNSWSPSTVRHRS